MASRRKPVVPDELLDQLLGGSDALEAFHSGDLVQDLKKALAERILNAKRGYAPARRESGDRVPA